MDKIITTDSFGDELDSIFNEFMHSSYEKRQEAVQAGAEFLKGQLEANAPKYTGQFALNFVIKTKLPNHRYVGNSTVVTDGKKTIPLINVLEYSEKHGHPFVRSTFDANESQIYQIIKSKL